MFSKQQGKGIAGFLLGLIVAVASIAGILFMLNNNQERDFKPTLQTPKQSDKAETLTPPAPHTDSHVGQDTQDQGFDKRYLDNDNAETANAKPAETPAEPVETVADKTPVLPSDKPEAQAAARKPEVKKAETRKPETKPEAKKPEARKAEAKPTPEQILNAGNIEKAREQAQKEAKNRETAKAAGKVSFQVGSFASKSAAEEQRGRVALMGVRTHISQAEVNGKTVYRVQTGSMDAEDGEQVRRTLQAGGIPVQTRKH